LVVSTASIAPRPFELGQVKYWRLSVLLAGALFFGALAKAECENETSLSIHPIEPPANGFYSKCLQYKGIPIKASSEVTNEALYAASARLAMLLSN
jgi:hypothetical protein